MVVVVESMLSPKSMDSDSERGPQMNNNQPLDVCGLGSWFAVCGSLGEREIGDAADSRGIEGFYVAPRVSCASNIQKRGRRADDRTLDHAATCTPEVVYVVVDDLLTKGFEHCSERFLVL